MARMPPCRYDEPAIVPLLCKPEAFKPDQTRPVTQAFGAAGIASQGQAVQGGPATGLKIRFVPHTS